METRQDVCQCLCIAVHLLIPPTNLFEAADKKTTLTGWVILAIAWLVSRFVASPLVRLKGFVTIHIPYIYMCTCVAWMAVKQTSNVVKSQLPLHACTVETCPIPQAFRYQGKESW